MAKRSINYEFAQLADLNLTDDIIEKASTDPAYRELVTKAINAVNVYEVVRHHPILDEDGAITNEYAKTLYHRHREANFRITDANTYLARLQGYTGKRAAIENFRDKENGINLLAYIPDDLLKVAI